MPGARADRHPGRRAPATSRHRRGAWEWRRRGRPSKQRARDPSQVPGRIALPASEICSAKISGMLLAPECDGLKVSPNLAIEAIEPKDFDALVICGGSGWDGPDAPDLTDVATRFHNAHM